MHLKIRSDQILGIFLIILSFSAGLAYAWNPLEPPNSLCKCTYLIPRTMITSRECGRCARCAWDMYTYGYTFKDKNPTLFTAEWLQEQKNRIEKCAQLIPYPETYGVCMNELQTHPEKFSTSINLNYIKIISVTYYESFRNRKIKNVTNNLTNAMMLQTICSRLNAKTLNESYLNHRVTIWQPVIHIIQ
jgi:hypothetical protein